MENRRDLFRKALTVAVAGTASTGLITSRALGNGVKPDLILPKELIVGQQVDVEAIKLELEEIWIEKAKATQFYYIYDTQQSADKAEKLLDKWRLMPNIDLEEFYVYMVFHTKLMYSRSQNLIKNSTLLASQIFGKQMYFKS